MAVQKVIAVTGATGTQGGGLAAAILDDPRGGFAVRALTRNPDSEKARALAARGAEVVHADMDDEASLAAAFAGAHGAFCVTNFWEHFSAERELQQARNLAQAGARAGLAHVIWSTLEDTREQIPLSDTRLPTLQGKYKVPHFDAKGEADRFFRELNVPTTFLRIAFYWDNFIHFGAGPRRGEDGILSLVLPLSDMKLPGIAAADIGRVAYGVFKEGTSQAGRTFGIAGDQVTGAEMAAAMGRALGEEVRWADIAPDAYRALGFPGADDMGNMFQHHQLFRDYMLEARSVEEARRFYPQVLSFEQWLERNGGRIPV
ncbi:MAG: NmrA/HSCARG family protein [Gemmatimonadetes bacterium]|nr:NmrA/HSCARG family protein [Gemmatimonadota bacterium]